MQMNVYVRDEQSLVSVCRELRLGYVTVRTYSMW